MANIVFEDVTKRFRDGTTAVSSLSLEIHDGECMVLVGPSGCGKTTALRMVAGLEDVTSGVIRIGDQVVTDMAPQRRDVAMVFQNYALYPHMDVHDNMAYSLFLRRQPKKEIERSVSATAGLLGLASMLKRKPKELSGGQRQRVAMGRAIVREPKAFLMDEPLSNLDAKLRVQMRAQIASLQRSLRATTIYVTHDQTEAMTMGHRVAVMRNGTVQQVDPPSTLYEHPRNLFVAGFIGSPAMNVLEAHLDAVDGAVYARFGSHRVRVAEQTLTAHAGLRDYIDAKVLLGIRPECFQDAGGATTSSASERVTVKCTLCEALGSDVLVHFEVDAPPPVTDDTRDLAADLGTELDELEIRGRETTTACTARLAPDTSAREGQLVELVVDTGRLHFFDPTTNLAI